MQQMKLYDAVFNSLKMAEALTCTSIAIPAISSGIYGFPVPLCAQIMFSAATAFIKSQKAKGYGSKTWLKHIRFVNLDAPTTEFMRAEFNFVVATGIPSIEFDFCRSIDDYKDLLQTKHKHDANP